nr:peptidoglycan DD-metalloendopeptidase family protein [Thalassotalea sp. G2M2-11]
MITLSIMASFSLVAQESTNDKLEQVKKEINQQKDTIKAVDLKRQQLLAQLKKNELAIAKVSKSLNATRQSLNATQQKLSELKQEKQQLTAEKKQQEVILAQQLRAAYSTGNHDYLKLLLNQEEPGKVQRTISYYQYLNKARIKEIDHYQATIEKLIDITNEQQQQSQLLSQLQRKQKDQKASLQAKNTARQQTINQLNHQLLSSKQQLAKLQQEEENLTQALARMARLSKQAIDLNGLDKLKRQLSWPVKGRISRSFGSRKQGYLKWKGVLLSAPVGREVKTIHHGTILFSDWLKGYGLVTVVDHGKGYMSLYGHNQALLKSVGDRVETGEPIALVGQSGGQSQSALYFEIRHNGQAVNPKLWCK